MFEVGSEPGSDRYHYFCRQFLKKGHEVTVLTSAVVYKLAKIRPECRGKWCTVSHRDGITIIHLWSYPNIRGSFVRRLIYLFTYMCLAFLAGCLIARPDVIYAPNTPGMVGWVGYLLSRFRRVPLVYEVADVWPDAAIAMGALTNPMIISVSRWMEKKTYERANIITALTRGIKGNLEEKGISPQKVALVTNGVDPEIFESTKEAGIGSIRMELSLGDRFVCLYLGAHGHYNSLSTIIETAKSLEADRRFVFVLIGDGDCKPRLIRMVEDLGLSNVVFLPPVPRVKSSGYLAMADVFLLPNRRGNFFCMNLPNKLFDYLISSRPIVVAGEGETGDVVRAANAGVVVPAEDSAAMAGAVVKMASMDVQSRLKLGANGRNFVLAHYHRKSQADDIEQVLISAAAGRGFIIDRHVEPNTRG